MIYFYQNTVIMMQKKKYNNNLLDKYGTRALVTGGSSWIGKQLAIQLAKIWFNLILIARNKQKLQILKTDLESEYFITCIIIDEDLSTKEWIDLVLQQSIHYDISLAIMNAWFGTSGLFVDWDITQEVNMLDLNCRSILILTQYFAKRFVWQKKWGIILLSSVVAFQWTPYVSHYAATKAYIQTLWEWIAEELEWTWVDILTVAPGPVQTWFGDRASMNLWYADDPIHIARSILSSLGKTTFMYPWWLAKVIWYSIALLPRRAKSKVMGISMKWIVK